MDHVAIMKKSWNMLPKILSGEKSIESRWYRTKRAPWDRIKKGDTVYFKNSGEAVRVKALVSDVLQFVITDSADAQAIIEKYGRKICLPDHTLASGKLLPRYCILIFLENPVAIKTPFHIDKTGFG